MRRIGAVVVLGLVLAGCTSAGDPNSISSPNPALPSTSPTATPNQAYGIDPGFNSAIWIPSTSRVLGDWTVVSVNGRPSPRNAVAGLSMVKVRGRYFAAWNDGSNERQRQWFLKEGKIRWGGESMTAVLCRGANCRTLSAFGVGTATRLKMSNQGDLVFMDQTSTPLAVYKRAGSSSPG